MDKKASALYRHKANSSVDKEVEFTVNEPCYSVIARFMTRAFACCSLSNTEVFFPKVFTMVEVPTPPFYTGIE